MILRSTAEPKGPLRAVGESSPLPETYGADFLILTPEGFIGIQRKRVDDLIASTRSDDRIARELGQSSGLVRMILVIEGDWRWDFTDPHISSKTCPGVLKAQVDGMMLSFQEYGWWILTSASMVDTARLVNQIDKWSQKARHNTLATRQKAGGLWGTHTNREWGVFWWQSIDGVGVEMAGRLYDALGVPACWMIEADDLQKVSGIGKQRAAKIIAALPPLTSARQWLWESRQEETHDASNS